jgi:hypothetical protein
LTSLRKVTPNPEGAHAGVQGIGRRKETKGKGRRKRKGGRWKETKGKERWKEKEKGRRKEKGKRGRKGKGKGKGAPREDLEVVGGEDTRNPRGRGRGREALWMDKNKGREEGGGEGEPALLGLLSPCLRPRRDPPQLYVGRGGGRKKEGGGRELRERAEGEGRGEEGGRDGIRREKGGRGRGRGRRGVKGIRGCREEW